MFIGLNREPQSSPLGLERRISTPEAAITGDRYYIQTAPGIESSFMIVRRQDSRRECCDWSVSKQNNVYLTRELK